MRRLSPAGIILVARVLTVGFAAVAAIGACARSSRPSPTPVRLDITGPTSPLLTGATGQMHATATFSDQSTGDVTNETGWSSSEPAILTVSSSGLLRALAVGVVQIRASYAGLNATASVEVRAGP